MIGLRKGDYSKARYNRMGIGTRTRKWEWRSMSGVGVPFIEWLSGCTRVRRGTRLAGLAVALQVYGSCAPDVQFTRMMRSHNYSVDQASHSHIPIRLLDLFSLSTSINQYIFSNNR